ncbi:MAG: LytR C-terminal domain-containing protein [Tetrasphaera sp.]
MGVNAPRDAATTASRTYRVRQLRRLAVLVTLPGLLVGGASIAAAYGVGLFHRGHGGCEPVTVPAPVRDSFDVTVLNAAETAGEAKAVAKEFTRRGFRVDAYSNAPEGVYIKRSAMVYHGPEGLDQALLVAKQIPDALAYDDGRAGESVQVVLGYGFRSLIAAPPPPPPEPDEIKINVYNTTWRAGLAGEAARELRARAFHTGTIGNDPNRAFLPDDVAVIRFGPDGVEQATVLRTHLPGARMQQDERTGTEIDIVLGNGFDHLLPLSEVVIPPKPPPTPPETVARPCATE